jgi:hypothetical protein
MILWRSMSFYLFNDVSGIRLLDLEIDFYAK